LKFHFTLYFFWQINPEFRNEALKMDFILNLAMMKGDGKNLQKTNKVSGIRDFIMWCAVLFE